MEGKRLATDKVVTRIIDTYSEREERFKRGFEMFKTADQTETLKSKPTEFIKQLIRDHGEVGSPDEANLDPFNWEFAAKRLHEICNRLRDRGEIVARYDCEEWEAKTKFTLEVTHQEAKTYKQYSSTLVQIKEGNMTLTKTHRYNLSEFYSLTDSVDNLTLIVGGVHFSLDCVTSGRVVLFISDSSELDYLKSIFDGLGKIAENPLKWEDISEETRNSVIAQGPIMVNSCSIEVNHELLELLEGKQLNQVLKTNTVHIGSKKTKAKDEVYIHRWLTIRKYDKIVLKENTIYVVFNAEESDIPHISEKVEAHLFHIEDIEDLTHLPVNTQVPVTSEIDCSAATKYLKNLCETSPQKTPYNIKLLKFEKNWLSEVIQEDDLLKLESRLAVIVAPSSEGKSCMLHRIYMTCSQPVCKFKSTTLLQHFSNSSIDDFTLDHVRFVLKDKISSSQFDSEILERSFEDMKIVVLIDDVNLERESNLFKVIKLMVQLPNMTIVLITNSENTPHAFRSLDKSFLRLNVLEMTKTDKIELITKISSLTRLHSQVIFNHYEFKFVKMPTMIWTAVSERYKRQFQEKHYNFSPHSMPLRVSVAEIHEKFVDLKFLSLVEDNPKLAQRKDQFLYVNMWHAIKKVLPDFLPTAESLLDIKKELCESNILNSTSSSFVEYFVDLFSFYVLTGKFNTERLDFLEKFTSFYIKRYILSSKPENHLNDILGYKMHHTAIKMDINKFDIVRVLLLCKNQPNICRILFESFLAQNDHDTFYLWCNSNKLLNATTGKLLRLLRWKDQEKLTITEILLLLSVNLGFSKLFRFIRDSNTDIVSMRDIKIRERQSFRSLLHLLMYQSRENDNTTINEKISIISLLLKDPKLLHARDYFGNTPVLERNVNFDLILYLAGRGARLDNTDFTGKDILDKNADNPAFTSMLMWDFPEIYDRLYLRVRSRFTPPTIKVDEKILQMYGSVTPNLIRKFLAGAGDENSTKLTLLQIAAYIKVALTHNRVNTDIQAVLLNDIFATSQMAFKHQDLCNKLNTCLNNAGDIDFKISRYSHELMCQNDSPFFVACINGYKNIALLLGKNFQPRWLEDLKDFELTHFFNSLEKHHGDTLLLHVTSALQENRFKIPCIPVRESLSSGNLNLFRIYTEKLQFKVDRWPELGRSKGFGVLHYVLENSMHDSSEVLARKQKLIDYILELHPESVKHRDKLGRTVLLLGRAHYQLIRYLTDKKKRLEAKLCEDAAGNNILNVCLGNIIRYSEYLGESAYDINFCKHDQVIYLANKVAINDLANKQIQWIMQGTQKLVKIKEKALKTAGFNLEGDKICSTGQSLTQKLSVDPVLMSYQDTSESEDESSMESRTQSTSKGPGARIIDTFDFTPNRRKLKRKLLSPHTSFGIRSSSYLLYGKPPKKESWNPSSLLLNDHRPIERSKSDDTKISIMSRAKLAKDNREARLRSQAKSAIFSSLRRNIRVGTDSISSPTVSRRHSYPTRDKTLNSIRERARTIVRNSSCQEELKKRRHQTNILPVGVCQIGYGMPRPSSSSDSKSDKLQSKK